MSFDLFPKRSPKVPTCLCFLQWPAAVHESVGAATLPGAPRKPALQLLVVRRLLSDRKAHQVPRVARYGDEFALWVVGRSGSQNSMVSAARCPNQVFGCCSTRSCYCPVSLGEFWDYEVRYFLGSFDTFRWRVSCYKVFYRLQVIILILIRLYCFCGLDYSLLHILKIPVTRIANWNTYS